MCFIDQKEIFPFYIFSEKPFQINIWVKHIIIITDDPVHPYCQVKCHLKWTDAVFLCLCKDRLPVKSFFFRPQFIDSIVYPVIMPLRIRTFLRITVHLIAEAHFFFGCDRNGFEMQAFPAED